MSHYETGSIIIIPVLRMNKLRHREVEQLARSWKMVEQWSQG